MKDTYVKVRIDEVKNDDNGFDRAYDRATRMTRNGGMAVVFPTDESDRHFTVCGERKAVRQFLNEARRNHEIDVGIMTRLKCLI